MCFYLAFNLDQRLLAGDVLGHRRLLPTPQTCLFHHQARAEAVYGGNDPEGEEDIPR